MRYWSGWRGILGSIARDCYFFPKVAKKLLGEGRALNGDSKG